MDDPSSKHQDLLPMCDDASSSSKKKKLLQKTVVTVKMEANEGKNRGEGPPSDFWSWRKYGQKPIKGSPYPRGYYRCSTSKGCSAKKQVERSRTDASVLIITYTCDHNHPGPNLQSLPIPDQENQPKLLNTQTPIPRSNSMSEMNQEVRREEESSDGKLKSLEVEEDNDFYDELEELLPMSSISSSFSSLTRGSNFFDERILLLP